jgi:hypothetical protein
MERIIFKKKNYPLKNLFLDNIPLEVTISTSDLNDVLMNQDGSYVSEYARNIDEGIFFYVERNEIELNDIELRSILKEVI